ncbi:MAG: OmpA family protein [Alphaproteobacteria bacterium]|nr:OmpA family protein [Alphaproteobacteria bacterium]
MLRHTLAMLLLLATLVACDSTASLEELRGKTPVGDDYSQALAAGYREFAEERTARYDWSMATYFADKGLVAAAGRDLAPEEPDLWEIPPAALGEFIEARPKLLAAVAVNRSTQPEMAAAAMVGYDRWLHLAYANSDAGAIAAQRDAFFAILTKLSEAQVASAAEVPTTTIPAESTSTVLYFPFDSDRLGDTALAALEALVRYVRAAGDVEISINGHADRAGSEQYNLDLSQRRARFVLAALKDAGIATGRMKYFAFGESDPAVPTADGVAEAKNRRVEIFIE